MVHKFSRSPKILGQLVSMGMKVFAKMVGLSRCNGKEGEVYDGMDTFVTLNRAMPAKFGVLCETKKWGPISLDKMN